MAQKKRHIRPLSIEEKKFLERKIRFGKDAKEIRKAQAILLSSQGFDLETLTEVVKASKSTIRNWFNAFEVEGIPSLARKKGSGAPHKLPTAFCESLESLLEKAPRVTADFESDRGRWTLSELKRYVNEHYQVKVTEVAIFYELRRQNLKLKRPQVTVSSPDPDFDVKKNESMKR